MGRPSLQRPTPFVRLVAGLLAALMAGQASLADAAATSLWSDRRQAVSRAARTGAAPALSVPLRSIDVRSLTAIVPPSLGRFEAARPAAGARRGAALLIQDIHQNFEGQKNIAAAVKRLSATGQLSVLGLEGADGALPVRGIRLAPDAPSLALAADFLLRQGRISGAAHAAITGPAIGVVEGIDDAELHRRNADAYRRSASATGDLRTELSFERARTSGAKARTFGPALAAFDAVVAAHREDRAPFAAYARHLADEGRRLGLRVPAAVSAFTAAAEEEASLDLERVDEERRRVLERMARSLPAGDARELLRLAVSFRAGELRHDAFYARFETFVERAGIPKTDIPALSRYFSYLTLADQTDAAETLRGADRLERDIFARLATTDGERDLIAADRRLHLAEKLSRFALTRDEWTEWSSTTKDGRFAPFEEFYALAVARDVALSDNLIKRMSDSDRLPVAVVGGFHAAALADRLAADGRDVFIFTPALTRLDDDGSAYLSVFSREKTPLERMFDGQRLFLAAHPLPRSATVSLLGMAAGRATATGAGGDFRPAFRDALGMDLLESRAQDGGARLELRESSGRRHRLDVPEIGAEGFEALPELTAAEEPTGTFAVGRALFGRSHDWVERTLRWSHVLELPQIYLSRFSRRFRDAFLTPGWNLPQKKEALARVHRGIDLAAVAGAAAGLAGTLLVSAVAPSAVSTAALALLPFAGAFTASLIPALRLHDIANRSPETRLTEGNPGSYKERLRAFLATLRDADDHIDPASGAFRAIADESLNLITGGGFSHEQVFWAWIDVIDDYRTPFEEFLQIISTRLMRAQPLHAQRLYETLMTSLSRHPEHAHARVLTDVFAEAAGRALADHLLNKRKEHWARDSEPIRVLEITPEVRPFRTVGGMGVVNGELPMAFNEFHAWAETVSLMYDDGTYDLAGRGSPYMPKEKMPFTLPINIAGELHVADVYRVMYRAADGTESPFYFLKDTFTGAHNVTRTPYAATSFEDLGMKQAVFLSEGALQLTKQLYLRDNRKFDVIRSHDWQAALAPIYLKTRAYAEDADMRAALAGVKGMGFFHNLEPNYRGEFDPRLWHLLGLGDEHKQAFGWEWVESGEKLTHALHGFNEKEYSLGKALLHHAEGLFVPSRHYARMIQDPEYGGDMASGFRARAHILDGIVNGHTYSADDELIYPAGHRPAEDFLHHVARAKILLLRETGLLSTIEAEVRSRLGDNQDPSAFEREMAEEINRPIIGSVLRLDTKMKGVWFFKSVGERLTHPDTPQPVRVVLLGSILGKKDAPEPNSAEFARQMAELASRRPSRVAFFPVGRKELSPEGAEAAKSIRLGKPIRTLNDLIQAGSIGLFPSRVEPGGIADVEAMERGAVVIVSDKGGFIDKHRDFDDPTLKDRPVSGAIFRGAYTDHEDLLGVVERLVRLYYADRDAFNQIAINNKNRRLTMSDMGLAHVMTVARFAGRSDIVQNPQKPVNRPSQTGAILAWAWLGLTHLPLIGLLEGLLTGGAFLAALAHAAPVGVVAITQVAGVTGAAIVAVLFLAHFVVGTINPDGTHSRFDFGRSVRATAVASVSLVGLFYIAVGWHLAGVPGLWLMAFGLAVAGYAHFELNRLAVTQARIDRALARRPAEPVWRAIEESRRDGVEEGVRRFFEMANVRDLYMAAMGPADDLAAEALRSLESIVRSSAKAGEWAEAIDAIHEILLEKRFRIEPEVISALIEALRSGLGRHLALDQLAGILSRVAEKRPDLVRLKALQTFEDLLESPSLPDFSYAIILEAMSQSVEARRIFASRRTVAVVEGFMRRPGHSPHTQSLAGGLLAQLSHVRPDLVRYSPFARVILTLPYHLWRQSWAAWPVFALGSTRTDSDAYDSYAVATAAHEQLGRWKLPVTAGTAEAAVATVRAEREAQRSRPVIDSTYSVITLTHAEDRFRNSDMTSIAAAVGVPGELVSPPYKGEEGLRSALTAVAQAQGRFAFMFHGHGGQRDLFVTRPTAGEAGVTLTYLQLGNALMRTARPTVEGLDLSHASLVIEACQSYGFAVRLLGYLERRGVTRMPTVISSAHRDADSFGTASVTLARAARGGSFTFGDVFAAEKAGFYHVNFTDLAVFAAPATTEGKGPRGRGTFIELGLAKPTHAFFSLIGVRGAFATAVAGGLLETAVILFVLPALLGWFGITGATAVTLFQFAAFPLAHLGGVMKPAYAEGGIVLRRTPISTGRFIQLALLGLLLHGWMPPAAALAAHATLNGLSVLSRRYVTTEGKLAYLVAGAIAASVRRDKAPAAWVEAMDNLISGRARRIGIWTFGGKVNARLADYDDTIDRNAFEHNLSRELEAAGLRNAMRSPKAFEEASSVALAGTEEASAEDAIAAMTADRLNLVLADTLSPRALVALKKRLADDPALRALVVLKSGSQKSARLATAFAGLTNVTVADTSDVYGQEAGVPTVRLAAIDALLQTNRISGERLHIWAGKDVRLDPAGLSEASALRHAVLTILDAMAMTAPFSRVELLDTVYRLLASQA